MINTENTADINQSDIDGLNGFVSPAETSLACASEQCECLTIRTERGLECEINQPNDPEKWNLYLRRNIYSSLLEYEFCGNTGRLICGKSSIFNGFDVQTTRTTRDGYYIV